MAKKPGLKTNFIYNLSYQILAIILPLITGPYISRVLGSHNVGVYTFTQATAHYFFLFAMLGVSNYGNRTIAGIRDKKEEISKTFWEIYAFQFFMGVLVCLAYFIYCFFWVKQDVFVTFLQFFYVVSGCFSINWLMFGLEEFKITTIRNVVVRVGMAVLVFVFVKSRDDLPIYTAILSGGSLVSVLIIWPFALKHIPFHKPTFKGIASHIKPNLILFWPVVAVSLYNIMDKIMLGTMSDKDEVGFYTYAENIVQIPNTLILALDNIMLPRMSNLFATNKTKQAFELMHNVMMFAALASTAMAFGLAGVGPIFAPWFYGRSFERCGVLIVMLSPIIIFKGFAGALRTQYIIPKKRDKVYLISLTTGACVNLIINFLLIPRMQGVGAVIGTIGAEFSVAFLQFFMLRKEIKVKKYLTEGLAFCVIGLIMYVLIRQIPSMNAGPVITMGLQIVAGAVIFIVLSSIYMIKILKQPIILNETLKTLKIRVRF